MQKSAIAFLIATMLGISLLAAPVHAARLYKWTDENGRVHLSDTPPPDMEIDVMPGRPGSAAGSNSPAPGTPPPGSNPSSGGEARAFADMPDDEISDFVRNRSTDELVSELRKDCKPGTPAAACDGYARDMAQLMKEALQHADQHPEGAAERREAMASEAGQRLRAYMNQACRQQQAMRAHLVGVMAADGPAQGEVISPEEWEQARREAPARIADIDNYLAQHCAP